MEILETELSSTPLIESPTRMTEMREIDLVQILIHLTREKRLIGMVTLVATVSAVVITLLVPNRYSATTKMLPPTQAQSASSMMMSQLAGSGAGALLSMAGKDIGLKDPADLYIGMLRSRTVSDAMIARFDLARVYETKKASSTRKALEDVTDIRSGKDALITITVEDKDPQRAADMANAYVAELRKLTQSLAVTEASQRSLFFDQQLRSAKEALSDAEVKLKETQQKTGLIDLDSQAKAMINVTGTLRGQVAAKEVELQAMRSFATERNSSYMLLQQELSGLRAQLAKLERDEQGGNGSPIIATAKVPSVALDYVRNLREVKYRETMFGILAQQFEIAKLDEAKQGAVIQVLDTAVTPDKKSSPKRSLIVLLVSMTTFFLSCVYVLVKDSFLRAQLDPVRASQFALLRNQVFGRGKAEAARRRV
jgi:tyrosine-protein kinase Etk/Wzc